MQQLKTADNDPSDADLIACIAKGDKQAFGQLVGRHMNSLYSCAFRMQLSQSDAEDIVQETMLRVWKKAALWNESKGAKVSTWMYTIAYNLCIDLKRKSRTTSMENIAEPYSDSTADTDIYNKEVKEKVTAAIAELPERQRSALILCHYQGVSNKDAAEILGVSLKALESLLVRAKKSLREILKTSENLLH